MISAHQKFSIQLAAVHRRLSLGRVISSASGHEVTWSLHSTPGGMLCCRLQFSKLIVYPCNLGCEYRPQDAIKFIFTIRINFVVLATQCRFRCSFIVCSCARIITVPAWQRMVIQLLSQQYILALFFPFAYLWPRAVRHAEIIPRNIGTDVDICSFVFL